MRNVLFASWLNYLDQSNGASISTRSLLMELSRRGWSVKTLCGVGQDATPAKSLDELIETHNATVRKRSFCGDYATVSFTDGGVESLALDPSRPRRKPTPSDIQAYLRLYRETLTFARPDVVLTYGDCGLASSLLSEARLSGAKTVVYLHNLSYMNIRWFRNVDLAVVPSRFAWERYRATIGLESAILPPLIDPPRADVKPVSRDERKHILYVNPEPGKGARFFVAIASALWKIRRDIRFLVAEGRAGRSALLRVGKDDLKEVGSVDYVGNVVDFHALYRASRIALIPSLYEETFGRVAAEALSAGVPVVASDRGALPEVVGAGGVLIKIPSAHEPTKSSRVPSASEIEPWVRAILRLWDDAAFYEEKQTNGRNQARRWEFQCVADAHESRLTALLERARGKR